MRDFNTLSFSRNNEDSNAALIKNFCNLFSLMPFNSVLNDDQRIFDMVFSTIECTASMDSLPSFESAFYRPALNIFWFLTASKKI